MVFIRAKWVLGLAALLTMFILPGCGQRPKIDIAAAVNPQNPKKPLFLIPHSDINGLLKFSVMDDKTGTEIWVVRMNYEKGGQIIYGELPKNRNADATQEWPADGSAPQDISGQKVRVKVEYQYDAFMAPSASTFKKTVYVP